MSTTFGFREWSGWKEVPRHQQCVIGGASLYPVPLLQRLFRKLTLKLGYKCVDEIAPRDTKSRWSKTLHLSNSPHLTVITVLLFIFDTGWGSHNWLFFMDVWSLRWLYEKSVIYYVYLQLLQLICEFIATRIPWKGQPRAQFSNQGYG